MFFDETDSSSAQSSTIEIVAQHNDETQQSTEIRLACM